MNTPLLPADPPPGTAPADPAESPIEALDAATQREKFNPAHPMLFVVHDGEERVDGLAIDPAPLAVLGTDASRGLGRT